MVLAHDWVAAEEVGHDLLPPIWVRWFLNDQTCQIKFCSPFEDGIGSTHPVSLVEFRHRFAADGFHILTNYYWMENCPAHAVVDFDLGTLLAFAMYYWCSNDAVKLLPLIGMTGICGLLLDDRDVGGRVHLPTLPI
ncbi:hypothetical protein ACLOJK_023976 [Asimina triloba]